MGAKIGGLVAAVVVLLGSFLPWLSISAFGMSETWGGMASEMGEDPLNLLGAGKLTLVAAIAMGVLFGLGKRATVIAAAGVSLLVLVIGIWDMIDIHLAFNGEEWTGVDISAGFGLYLVVIGALAGIVLGVIGQMGITTTTPGAFGATAYGAAQAPAAGATAYGAAQAPAWGQQPQQYVAPAQQAPQQYVAPAQQAPQQYVAPAQMPVQQAPAQAAPAQAPAGWLPDPYGQAQLRYWDGVRWTEHTHNQ